MSASDEKRDATGWSASTYNKVASFVYSKAYTSPVLELLAAQPGERILDLGCGSGELTKGLAKAVGSEGVVVGVDASESMVRTSVIPISCLTRHPPSTFTDRESKAERRGSILCRRCSESRYFHTSCYRSRFFA